MLRGKQKRYLRSQGHNLEPLVLIGKDGLNDGVITSVRENLERHELIKIKIQQNSDAVAAVVAEELAEMINCEVAQILGHTILLYKRSNNVKNRRHSVEVFKIG
ncbi:MAG: ribosome assembly RNA-binding protein YhbY [Lactobacillales bacterium]|jgi:RNA-binding protein|nr:ribosome assembly RNA-binding protein YhbY [Lactobacillales bacterium]